MSSESDHRFLVLRPGLILPWTAVLPVLALERAGHQLRLDATGSDILIEPAKGIALDPHDLDDLRRWKGHALLFLDYCLSDKSPAIGVGRPPSVTENGGADHARVA